MRKNYIWNPATCSCENGKYVGSIIDDTVITCDEIIEKTKTVPKTKRFLYSICLFINYHTIIDNFQYLLLSDKI